MDVEGNVIKAGHYMDDLQHGRIGAADASAPKRKARAWTLIAFGVFGVFCLARFPKTAPLVDPIFKAFAKAEEEIVLFRAKYASPMLCAGMGGKPFVARQDSNGRAAEAVCRDSLIGSYKLPVSPDLLAIK